MKNKKIIIICSVIVAIILAILIFSLLTKGDSQEKKLTEKMETMGRQFYEEFYYEQVGKSEEEKKSFVKKYETIGIKVSLSNLSRYNTQNSEEILKEFVNSNTKESCDKDNSKVIIYPQSPYEKNNYKIEVKLECGFTE